jgi:hypothetical protein
MLFAGRIAAGGNFRLFLPKIGPIGMIRGDPKSVAQTQIVR